MLMKDEKHEPVLTPKEEKQSINPKLWLGLLAVPLLLGLLVGFVRGQPEEPPPPVVRSEQPKSMSMGRGSEMSQTAPQQPEVFCEFDPWVGYKVTESMLAKLKAANNGEGRPYRILPPGSMMTKDYRPERVNFDVTETGVITRIWCG